jgi:hypothetical protein
MPHKDHEPPFIGPPDADWSFGERSAARRMWDGLAKLGELQMAQGTRLQSGGQALVRAAERQAVAAELALSCTLSAARAVPRGSLTPLRTRAAECLEAAARSRAAGEALIAHGLSLLQRGRANLVRAKVGLLTSPPPADHVPAPDSAATPGVVPDADTDPRRSGGPRHWPRPPEAAPPAAAPPAAIQSPAR